MNCMKVCIRSTTSPKICCRTTMQKLNVQLSYFTACYFNALVRRIIYLQYLSTRDAKFCFLCLRRSICNHKNCVKIVCHQHTNMLRDMHAVTPPSVNDCVSDVVKCCSLKCLAGAVAKYSVMLNEVSSARKYLIS